MMCNLKFLQTHTMAAALTLLVISCLLQGGLCGKFEVFLPQTIEALTGSCVTIPCSFDVEDKHLSALDNTCKAVWRYDYTVEFGGEHEPAGNFTAKDCTTTLKNVKSEHSKTYHFRLECKGVTYSFNKAEDNQVTISVKADPPTPTLTSSTLKAKEGSSVSLTCSAPAPCLTHPPNLTWTPSLGDSQETLQENPDKTKVKTSVLNFTASHLHHGKEISCTARYNKQGGSTESSVNTTADISFSPKQTTVSVSPSGPVAENSVVTLTCSSTANPAVTKYTWYRADGGQETFMGTGAVLKMKASDVIGQFLCKAENDLGDERSNISEINVQFSPKQTTVSVSPSGPVAENSVVTLTCSSTANPAVTKYTWYRADGGQETFMGTGAVLKMKASNVIGQFLCKAENDLGDGRSNISEINVQFSPKQTTVSVSPSGPVAENSVVTLTCSSTANPAVTKYTWYRADGGQETFMGTGAVLKMKASDVIGQFLCKAENDLGDGRSNISEINVQFSPKQTTVSVSPSGPVAENSVVTLTCSSTANPAVTKYTWYRADGGQETFMGTGAVLKMIVFKNSGHLFCKAENDLGAGRSNISQINLQFAPQILSSSDCTKTAAQLNCSCETVGNPSPTLQWYLDGLPVNHSDKVVITNEPLHDRGLSVIAVTQPQWRDLSTLTCRSSNSLGSATQRFHVYSLEPQTSGECHDRLMLPVFISTVAALLVLLCVLLLVIRAQRTAHNLLKSQCTGDAGTVLRRQHLTNGEENQVPNTAEDDIYVNTKVLRQADVAHPTTITNQNSTGSPNSGPNYAESASKSSEMENQEGSDVIYSIVHVRSKSKKKTGEDAVDVRQLGSSYLEEERCMVGSTCRNFVSKAMEMESLFDEVEPVNVNCDYAQVKFKKKSVNKK